jgi:hypothetical protein
MALGFAELAEWFHAGRLSCGWRFLMASDRDTARGVRDMLAPGVFGSLGPQADIRVDFDMDAVRVVSPWGEFEITRVQIADGSWKRLAGEGLARLRALRQEREVAGP